MSSLFTQDAPDTIHNMRPPDPPDGIDKSKIRTGVDSYLPLSSYGLWVPAAAEHDSQPETVEQQPKPASTNSINQPNSQDLKGQLIDAHSATKALPALPFLGPSTSTGELSKSPMMPTRSGQVDRVGSIFRQRHLVTRVRSSGPATPPATTSLHQLVLASGANSSTGNVSITSSPATTITTGVSISPRSSASLESLGLTEGETEGEDLTGGTFASTSTSTSASASAEEEECAVANASADTIRTHRSTRPTPGTIKGKANQGSFAYLGMLVAENEDLFKRNEDLRNQVTQLKASEAERLKREAVVRKEALLRKDKAASTKSSQLLQVPPAGRVRTADELQKKLERKREKHEVTRRKLAWAQKQWASADYIGTVFATCFKQQRTLAEERVQTIESLQSNNGGLRTRNESLEALLLEVSRDRDAMSLEREALKEAAAIAQARVSELIALDVQAKECIARLESQSLVLEERCALAEEKNRELANKNAAQAEENMLLTEQRAQIIDENTRLADEGSYYRKTNAKLLDKNARLALTADELQTRTEELGSQMEGLEARNEELCETIRLLQEREEELEAIVEDSKGEMEDMRTVLDELEYAYNELRTSGSAGGSAHGYHDAERASVTSDDMDIAGLEEAANAVNEDGEYVGDNDATPSKSRMHRRSSTYDRPPSTTSDIDTSDPIIVAAQIKRLQCLLDEYHETRAIMRSDRQAQEERAAELEAIEDDLQKRLDEYKEISIDFRQREADFFANCEAREREFLDLSDEYERWRMDCEVREVDVEEDRIEVWRFRNEVEARLARCIKREEVVRRKEGEVRWRIMCLDGAFKNPEGECSCWRCLEAPAELFPPTPPVNFEWLDEEYEKMYGSPRRGRGLDGKQLPPQEEQTEESLRIHDEEMDGRYLREELDDAPFEFDGRDAVKQYLAEQERHERDRREDEYVDMDEEAERIRLSAEAYDVVVRGRVAELIRKADEKRRQLKEREERAAAGPGDGEIQGVYDDALANLNVDGLHGLGLIPNPDRCGEENKEASTGSTASVSVAASEPTPTASTSSSSTSNALADSSATRELREGEVEGGLSSSWEEVRKD